MRRCDSNWSFKRGSVGQPSRDCVKSGLSYRNTSSGTSPRMDTFIYIDAKVLLAPELFRCHELDPHILCAIGYRLFELKVPRAFHSHISQILQLRSDRELFAP